MRFKFMYKIIIFILTILPVKNVLAASTTVRAFFSGVTPECRSLGDCELNELVNIGINWAYGILTISASIAMFMFVIGGFLFLLSGGNKEWVDRGKNTIIGSVIGLVIILASGLIIKFVANTMGLKINTMMGF